MITAVVVFLLCGVVSYQMASLKEQRAEYQKKISELEGQVEQLEEEAEDIQEYSAYVQTKKYVEEIARERLGLVYEDEIIFEGN